MTVHSHVRQEQVQLARYRDLERKVTDPLALCWLHMIVEELEADLQRVICPSGSFGNHVCPDHS